MRKHAAALAKFLPPKIVTERIIPWITLLLGVFAGAFTLYQFSSNISGNKVAETITLYRSFMGISSNTQSIYALQNEVTGLNDELRNSIATTKCEYYATVISSNQLDSSDTLKCGANDWVEIIKTIPLTPDQKKVLKSQVETTLESLKPTKEEAANLHRIIGFYLAVVTCVKEGGCDRGTAVNLFASHMIDFINAHCVYFRAKANQWNGTPVDDAIVYFLTNSGVTIDRLRSSDSSRTHIFFCPRHIDIETLSTLNRFIKNRLGDF